MNATSLRRPSKRQQVKDAIVQLIGRQKLAAGDQILGQNELAKRLRVTAVTIHKALSELAADGVLHRVNGKGTFVGRGPQPAGVRTVCLVLPGEHLDQPEYNPVYWPHVQRVYRAFLGAVRDEWDFTTRAVTPDVVPAKGAADLARYDVVFFHHTKQPRTLLDLLLREGRTSVVAMGLPEPGLPCLTVDHDMVAGMARAVTYLARLGHRRLAFVGSQERWADLWVDGFRRGLKEAKLPFLARHFVRVGDGVGEGRRAAALLLDAGREFDAVVVDGDLRAVEIIDGLDAAGVRVPEDVGVIGYEGLDHCTRHAPFLTTVEIPYEAMIRAALAEVGPALGQPSSVKHLSLAGDILPGRTVRPRPA